MEKIVWSIFLAIGFTSANHTMQRINANKGLRGIKILHMSFHLGCIKDFEEVAKKLGLYVTSWFILSSEFRGDFFDGCNCGGDIYNISANRARRVWERHKIFFDQFDVVMTSDTTALSRIFLDNEWSKPQIIWVCNRFDFCYEPSREPYPDKAYYDLINNAKNKPNVFVISYTDFEWIYASEKNVDLGRRTIRPVGSFEDNMRDGTWNSLIPTNIDKKETILLYPRFDEVDQIRLIIKECFNAGVKLHYGEYNGPRDLEGFKGILYFPYQWSNIALFENIHRGIVHFVPTVSFLQKLYLQGKPIRAQTLSVVFSEYHRYCEWYTQEFKDLFVYFDSWQDLKQKIENLDYDTFKKHVQKRGEQIHKKTLGEWSQLFDEITKFMSSKRKLPEIATLTLSYLYR